MNAESTIYRTKALHHGLISVRSASTPRTRPKLKHPSVVHRCIGAWTRHSVTRGPDIYTIPLLDLDGRVRPVLGRHSSDVSHRGTRQRLTLPSTRAPTQHPPNERLRTLSVSLALVARERLSPAANAKPLALAAAALSTHDSSSSSTVHGAGARDTEASCQRSPASRSLQRPTHRRRQRGRVGRTRTRRRSWSRSRPAPALRKWSPAKQPNRLPWQQANSSLAARRSYADRAAPAARAGEHRAGRTTAGVAIGRGTRGRLCILRNGVGGRLVCQLVVRVVCCTLQVMLRALAVAACVAVGNGMLQRLCDAALSIFGLLLHVV